MRFCLLEEAVPRETALQYYDAASDPKQIEWHDADHEFTKNAQAPQDRLQWLSTKLNLP